MEERDGNGNLLARYVYGHDLISQTRPSAGSGTETSYYLYDGLGSTRALTNSAGTVTDTYTYDAFGNLLDNTGSTTNDYLYAGEFFDSNIGFYYLRAVSECGAWSLCHDGYVRGAQPRSAESP